MYSIFLESVSSLFLDKNNNQKSSVEEDVAVSRKFSEENVIWSLQEA